MAKSKYIMAAALAALSCRPAAEEPAPAGEGEEPAVEEEEGEPIPGVPEGLIRGPRADEYRRGR